MVADIIVCFNMTEGIRKHIHDNKLSFRYFTLGGSGSPEKDRGFVFFVGGGSVVYSFIDVFPLPFPLGDCTGTSLGSVLTLVSSFFTIWYWVPPGLILP